MSERNVKRTKESLEYRFSDFDKTKLAGVLAELCQKREGAVLAKQRAMSAHGAELKRLNEEIAEKTRAIMRGSETRMIDCEWHMHDPRDGWKTLYRLDTGEVVASEEMDWAEKQGALFPEGRAWPLRLPDGTWDFKGAMERVYRPSDNSCVELYALEVQPDVWLRGWNVEIGDKRDCYAIGKGDEAIEVERLADAAPDAYDSAQEAIAEAASDVLDLLDKWEGSPAVARASTWCDLVVEGKTDEEIAAAMQWPQPDEEGIYSDHEAEIIAATLSDVPEGCGAMILVLQVGESSWASAWRFRVGDSRQEIVLQREFLTSSRDEAIDSVAFDACDKLDKRIEQLTTKKAKAPYQAVRDWFATHLAPGLDADTEAERAEQQDPEPEPEADSVAQQAVAEAEQHRGKATGAADWQ